jgi:hypothetical protein
MSTSSDAKEVYACTGPVPDSRPGSERAREQDAIYQDGQLVARVITPEVDTEAKEIRFEELYNSDNLLLPDECEFQKYIIMIKRIAYASTVEKGALHKGRVLRQVVAEILGYREQ